MQTRPYGSTGLTVSVLGLGSSQMSDAELGVLAKRPIANAWWKYDTRPDGVYGEVYWDRMQQLAYDVDLDPLALALRFSTFAPGVSSAITGSTDFDKIRRNIEVVVEGPLPDDVVTLVRERWAAVAQTDGVEWDGQG